MKTAMARWALAGLLVSVTGSGCGLDDKFYVDATGTSTTTTSAASTSSAGGTGGTGGTGGGSTSTGGDGGTGGGGSSMCTTATWAKSAGESSESVPGDVAIDDAGNVVVVGHYINGGIGLGDGGTNATGDGNPDVFVVKLDKVGQHQWSQYEYDSSKGQAHAVAVHTTANKKGNVVVAGTFLGSIGFDGPCGTLTSKPADSFNGFVAELDGVTGACIWAKGSGVGVVETDSAIFDVAVGLTGNVYVTGTFQGQVSLGPGPECTPPAQAGPPQPDAFYAKLGPGGSCEWVRTFGGPSPDAGRVIGVDSGGNVAVAGQFYGGAFPDGPAPDYVNGLDGFIALVGPDGGTKWARGFGGVGNFDDALDVAVEPDPVDGRIFLFGSMGNDGQLQGCDDVTGALSPAAQGEDHAFVASLTQEGGSCEWIRRFPGTRELVEVDENQVATYYKTGGGLTLDPAGNVVVVGGYVGKMECPTEILNVSQTRNVFATWLDPEGGCLWNEQYGDAGKQEGRRVASRQIAGSGSVICDELVLLGRFESEIDLGAAPPLTNSDEFGGVFAASLPPPE